MSSENPEEPSDPTLTPDASGDEHAAVTHDAPLARALVVAREVEPNRGGAWLGDLGRKLHEAAQAEVEPVRSILAADSSVCWMHMQVPQRGDTRNAPFDPWQPELLPDDLRVYFEARADESIHEDARLRYHEILWSRWRDHGHAIAAHGLYLKLARQTDPADDESAEQIDRLIRAGQLAMQLNHDRVGTAQVMRDEVRRALPTKNLGYPCFVVESSARLLASDPADARRLVEELELAAEGSSEFHRKEGFLEACAQMLRALGDPAGASGFMARVARTFEEQAGASDSGIVKLHFLTKAGDLYTDLGLAADAQRVKMDIIAAGTLAQGEMKTIRVETQIDPADFEAAAKDLSAHQEPGPIALLMIPFELGLWPAWETFEAATEEARVRTPIQFLVGHVRLDHDARSHPDPEDPAELAAAQVARTANQRLLMHAAFLPFYLDVLRESGVWDVEKLTEALDLVDAEVALACAPGLRSFESGDHWSAIHVLIPQIERLLRLIGMATGETVASYTSTSGIRWSDMGTVIELPSVRQVLTDALAKALEVVFLSPYGSNLRNNFAHGALDPRTTGSQAAGITVMSLLSVAFAVLAARGQLRKTPGSGVPTFVAAEAEAGDATP